MPQLDYGSWLNQTTTVLLGFWFLTYVFFFAFLTQGAWLLKFRTKVTLLRQLLHAGLQQQTAHLGAEGLAVQLLTATHALATTSTLVAGGSAANTRFEVLGPTLAHLLGLTTTTVGPVETLNGLTLALPLETV